jgi:hypothetical protein
MLDQLLEQLPTIVTGLVAVIGFCDLPVVGMVSGAFLTFAPARAIWSCNYGHGDRGPDDAAGLILTS